MDHTHTHTTRTHIRVHNKSAYYINIFNYIWHYQRTLGGIIILIYVQYTINACVAERKVSCFKPHVRTETCVHYTGVRYLYMYVNP